MTVGQEIRLGFITICKLAEHAKTFYEEFIAL